MKRLLTSSAVLACLGAASGACVLAADEPASPAPAVDRVSKAIAVLLPTAGNKVTGVVSFTKEEGKVRVVADVSGLAPGSRHGFHVHDFGDCSAPDATSAGGHFNPHGHAHAGPGDAQHHGGDLGNIVADAAGKAHLDLTVDGIAIGYRPASILGRGVILHAQEDDLKTQPTGNAGARIACGTIGIANDGIVKEAKPK